MFSYATAKQAELPAGAWALDHTISFTAEDKQSAVWLGVPGYSPRARAVFPAAAARAPTFRGGPSRTRRGPAARAPPGMGRLPVSWESGQSLALERNPHYFGAPENQAAFDQLRFSVHPRSEEALAKLADAATCLTSPITWKHSPKNSLARLLPLLTCIGRIGSRGAAGIWHPARQLRRRLCSLDGRPPGFSPT